MVDLKALGEGMSLGGVYTLERCLQDDRAGTFFAVLTRDGERLLAKLVPEQDPDAERQFATWQRTRHLRHAHLLHLTDVDSTEVAGEGYVYGIFEYPDDVLKVGLEQGPLSEQETSGVLEAALAALRYLHGQGMVHGAVDPDHIVAVGDNIKLSTDALRESEDMEGCLEDVRQLGELLRSLRAPEPLSEPLATVVEHATAADPRQRWTLAEIARVIDNSQPALATVAAEAPIPAPAGTPVAPAVPEPVSPAPLPGQPRMLEPVAPALLPVDFGMAEPIPPGRGERDVRSPGGFPKWIIAGMAILLFSILMLNFRRKPDTSPDIAPVATAGQPAAKPVAPSDAIPAPPVIAQYAAFTPPVRGNWRVIAFTFRSRDMASKKVKQLNEKWPDLGAAVFAPKGHREYFLVALGDWMTREEAERKQRKVRGLGLPRDTYVQNYSE